MKPKNQGTKGIQGFFHIWRLPSQSGSWFQNPLLLPRSGGCSDQEPLPSPVPTGPAAVGTIKRMQSTCSNSRKPVTDGRGLCFLPADGQLGSPGNQPSWHQADPTWRRDPWAPVAHLGLCALGFVGCAPALPWAESLSAPRACLPKKALGFQRY